MPMDSVLGRKNGKKDCYYEWTLGFRQIKVGNCFMEIKGLDDVFLEYIIQSLNLHAAATDFDFSKSHGAFAAVAAAALSS